jgi:hypothetical protein
MKSRTHRNVLQNGPQPSLRTGKGGAPGRAKAGGTAARICRRDAGATGIGIRQSTSTLPGNREEAFSSPSTMLRTFGAPFAMAARVMLR